MMSGHRSLEMVIRYDQHRDSLKLNAVNFLNYTDKIEPGWVGEGDEDDGSE
jgi:hypothetical protein